MTIQTALSERELANRIHDKIEDIYQIALSRKPGDSEADERLAEKLEELSQYEEKLKFANLRRLQYDADINAKNDDALKKIEHILNEIITGEKTDIRSADYLRGMAKRLRWKVGSMQRKAGREKKNKLKDIERQQKKLERQKKDIEKGKKTA